MKLLRIIAACWLLCTPALADEQASYVWPTAPVVGPAGSNSLGSLVANYFNPALRALASCSAGTTAPANGPSGAPLLGQCWFDTSASPIIYLRYWDGAQFAALATLDASSHAWVISGASPVRSVTGTTDTIQDNDRAKLVDVNSASVVAQTLPQAGAGGAFASGWYVAVRNAGSANVTVTPTVSTIDGVASLVIRPGQSVTIRSTGSNYVSTLLQQPANANLWGLAGLSTAADKCVYWTGAGTPTLMDCKAWVRAVIAAPDAVAGRSALGVAIGADVQAWDADLDAFANKMAPAGAVVGTTDAQTLTNKTLVAPSLGVATATSLTVSNTLGEINIYDASALAVGIGGKLNLNATTSSGATTYAAIKGYATNGTLGTQAGDLQILTMRSGTLTQAARFMSDGRLLFGGGILAPAASGTLTLPNATDTLVGRATPDTLTNKTLTAPLITAPTGIVKADVGLGNIDNTSDATKWAAVATMTNKTFDCAANTCTVRLGSDVTGTLQAANFPALTGDVTTSAGSLATSIGAGKVTSAMLNADVYSTAHAWSGTQSFSGAVDLKSAVLFTGVISPSQITGSQNNYAPTGFSTANVLRLNSDAARDITGLAGGADGRTIIVHNIGTFAISLINESGSSTAGNRFLLGGDIALSSDTSITLRYDGTSSRWRAISTPGAGGGGGGGVSGVTIAAGDGVRVDGTCNITTNGTCAVSALHNLRGYIDGLILSTTGSSATFNVAPGVATDATAASMMRLASAISKTTSGWASGSGNGSLDTGSIAANTWYHVFLIQRTDTGATDALVSLSATSPTLPVNYTLFRRIGSMKTNGSNQWVGFVQRGNEFLLSVPVTDLNTTTLGTTAVSVTLAAAPTGIPVDALLNVVVFSTTAGAGVYVSSLDVSDQFPDALTPGFTHRAVVGGLATPLGGFRVRLNTSAQCRARATGANTQLILNTYGWIDSRGRE